MKTFKVRINPNIDGIEVSTQIANELKITDGSLHIVEASFKSWLLNTDEKRLKTFLATERFMIQYDEALRKLAE